MVTGASQLAAHTGAAEFRILSLLLYALLATAWSVVATGTARGLYSGTLLAK